MGTRASGHQQLDHTADLCLRLWGPTAEAVLLEGARAIVGILTEAATLEPTARRTLTIDGLDREDLLVRWLNEVLVLALTEGFLVTDATLRIDGLRLVAEVRGQANAQGAIVTELKSVTYNHLAFTVSREHCEARVVIDV
ncbi:MAG TPA: archease [Myxococcota bacterium]|nr:archease [Myxococcota bacterium]